MGINTHSSMSFEEMAVEQEQNGTDEAVNETVTATKETTDGATDSVNETVTAAKETTDGVNENNE